jgi:hypothetical protein
MTTTDTSLRLMAPWWSHLMSAKADNKLVLREVKKDIAPFAEQLKNDATYRADVQKLLATDGFHVTKRAKAELEALLANVPFVYRMPATVMGQAQFHPGQGVMNGHGPSVSMRVVFGEGTAKAVTKSWYDTAAHTLFVQVHGEATHLTRMVSRPQDLSIDVGMAPSFGTWKLRVLDENGKVIGRGPDFSGMPPC